MKEQAKSFHLNGHIIGFGPQTQKLESPYKTSSNTLAVKGLNPCFALSTEVAKKQKCRHNCEGGLVGIDRGLSSQRIFPSHAQNFLEFWKSPADLAIIPQVNLKKQKQNT